MNHRMSFRQRKSASNKDSMKKMPKGKNYSIHSRIPAFYLFSSLVHVPKCGQGLISPCMVLSPQLQVPDIMGGLVDLQLVQVDTLQVEQVGDTTTRVMVAKGEEVMAAVHILHKDEPHHILPLACLVVLHVEEVVDMELVLQIILKVVHTVVLVLGVAQT